MKRLQRLTRFGRRPRERTRSLPPPVSSPDDEIVVPLLECTESDDDDDDEIVGPLQEECTETDDPPTAPRPRTLTRQKGRRTLRTPSPRSKRVRAVQDELDATRAVMRQNLEDLVDRGEVLEAIEETTFKLAREAEDFRGKARDLKRAQFWRKWRVCLLLSVLVVLAVLGAGGYGLHVLLQQPGGADSVPAPPSATSPAPAPSTAAAPTRSWTGGGRG